MDELPTVVFQALRQMDAEADTVRDGSPTGLLWYGPHARRDLKKNWQNEPYWSKGLADRLTKSGHAATTEVAYPNQEKGRRSRCDVVIDLPDGGHLWLEIKGAWKDWCIRHGMEWIYQSYLLHPLVPGLDKTKTHTASLDLEKLKAVTPPDGTHVGLLLIGFDSDEHPMSDDVAEFERLAGLDQAPWSGEYETWPDPHRPAKHVRCWFWVREV